VAGFQRSAALEVCVDEATADMFNAAERKSLVTFSGNLVKCSWRYRPTAGGMISATVEAIAKRGGDVRNKILSGGGGVVSIYAQNHRGTDADESAEFDANEGRYLLFQGVLEEQAAGSESDSITFKVRGFGDFLKRETYTGAFTDESIGDIAATVLADLITRANTPIKSWAGEDMTVTGGVPDSYHPLHKTLAGEWAWADAPIATILADLQAAAGGPSVVCFGVRPKQAGGGDDFGEAFFKTWRGEAWNAEYSQDNTVDTSCVTIGESACAEFSTAKDFSSVKNSVSVYGAEKTNAPGENYAGAAEAGASAQKYGRRHQIVTQEALVSDFACAKYAALWVSERAEPVSTVKIMALDALHYPDSGGGSDYSPTQLGIVPALAQSGRMVQVLRQRSDFTAQTLGQPSKYFGWENDLVAAKLSKVASGDPPHIAIDTSEAPFYLTDWANSANCGFANKLFLYSQFGDTRSLLYSITYAIPDGDTAALEGRVLVELTKRLRLRISQSGGAGADFGFDLERFQQSDGWTVLESAVEIIPANTNIETLYFRLGGFGSVKGLYAIWHSMVTPWRTLLSSASPSTTGPVDLYEMVPYANVHGGLGGLEGQITIGCGSGSSGLTTDPTLSGNWEIYQFRVDEGRRDTTTSKYYYANGHNEEGTDAAGTVDANNSHIFNAMGSVPVRGAGCGSMIMKIEPAIYKTISGTDTFFVRYTFDPTFHDGTGNGYHASLENPQAGDGVLVGDSALVGPGDSASAANENHHALAWRLGIAGDYARDLDAGVQIVPADVTVTYAGAWAPLSVKITGGRASNALTGNAEDMLNQIEALDRKTTQSL
jgi:hypothetical protein